MRYMGTSGILDIRDSRLTGLPGCGIRAYAPDRYIYIITTTYVGMYFHNRYLVGTYRSTT